MVEKRYQWLSNQGVKWTPWFNLREGNSLKDQKGLEKWQVKGKLLNEYRVVENGRNSNNND